MKKVHLLQPNKQLFNENIDHEAHEKREGE